MVFSNDKNKYFLIFLVVTLIVSITPASAALIYQNNEFSVSESSAVDNAIAQDVNGIQNSIKALNGNLNYIINRLKDYNWRFWKWPGITRDILRAFGQMTSTSIKMKAIVVDLNKNVKTLKNTPNIDNDPFYNTNATEDAEDMATELNKRLNTNITVENVTANEIEEGDIIQYLSQEKYPRYLEVKNVTNEYNAKQVRNDKKVPLIFAGIYNTIFAIDANNYLRLNLNGADTEPALKTGVEIQNETIIKNIQNIACLKKRSDNLKEVAELLMSMSPYLVLMGLAVAATEAFPEAISILALSAGLLMYGLFFLFYGKHELKHAHDLEGKVQLYRADFNHVASTEKQITTMNITTFNGIPIVKKPPNYKECIGYLSRDPHHGIVLLEPGIQFLYGPDEGYIGSDQFRIEYIGNGELKTLEIQVTIQKIPIVPIPFGG